MKKQKGRPLSGGVKPIAVFGRWAVYIRSDNGEWLNIKVVLWEGRAEKANYWLSWSRKESRWAGSTDGKLAAVDLPELLAQIEQAIPTWHPLPANHQGVACSL